MGKNSVLGMTIFAMLLPISVFYGTDSGFSFTIAIGLFYAYLRFDILILTIDTFGIFEFKDITGETSFFSQDSWEGMFGTDDGQTMMILWAATLGLAALGLLITMFDPKTGGIFILLAAFTSIGFAVMGYMALDDVYGGLLDVYPIPIGALFYLIAGIMGLKTEEF